VQGRAGFGLRRDAPVFPGERGRFKRLLGATTDPDFVPAARRTILSLALPVVVTLTLNAAGVIQERTCAAYLLGVAVAVVSVQRYVRTAAALCAHG